MYFRTVFFLFALLYAGFVHAEINSLPSKLGKLTLGAPLPKGLFDSSKQLHQENLLSGYDAREPIARAMWRSLSPYLDNENTVADVSTYKGKVVLVGFYMYQIRFPRVITALTSMYGKPKLIDMPESEISPHIKEWIWKNKNTTLQVVAEPESLQWELGSQVFYVNI